MIAVFIRLLSPNVIMQNAVRVFRRALQRLSGAAIAYGAAPQDLAKLGRVKLYGLANKEYAEAVKNFNEAEAKAMDLKLSRRVLESRVRKEEAESRLAEVNLMEAELALVQKLNELGVSLVLNDFGRLTIRPTPQPIVFSDMDIRKVQGTQELKKLAMGASKSAIREEALEEIRSKSGKGSKKKPRS
jgi:hypothetical protein